jgi:F-type H+-transporting ATPase subunit alpha
LRRVPVNKIKEFEVEYLTFLKANNRNILDALKAGQLTDEVTSTLEKVCADLSARY